MIFQETGLCHEIVQATEELGYEEPTLIQQEVIPIILNSDRDLISLAQTGTGKTAAFGLPLIQLTDASANHIQTIVICPTRELCMQIASDMQKFSKNIKGFRSVAVYGGADIRSQVKQIKAGCHMVVGTPGRVLDLIHRKAIRLSSVQWVVLDEADEMLNMGFKEELNDILVETPAQKRTLLFSATMPKGIADISKRYITDPIEVSIGTRNQGAENVRHEYYTVQARDRYATLKRITDMYPNIYGIVFCRTRRITREVAEKLVSDGYNADALHGDLSQAQRDHVMNRFRHKGLQLLVATDVAARGLDVSNLTHIINYDLPDDNEVYIHRTGRTARAGKSGLAISIIHTRERKKIRDIERMTGKRFTSKKVPTGREVCEKQLFNLVDRVEKVEVNEEQIGQFLPVINKKLAWLSRDELVKHFVSVEFNRFLSYYKDAPDLNTDGTKKNRKKSQDVSFVPLRMNVGQKQGIKPTRLIGMINEYTRKRDIPVGKIDIGPGYTLFEVDKDSVKDIQRAFRNVTIAGVHVELENVVAGRQSSKRRP